MFDEVKIYWSLRPCNGMASVRRHINCQIVAVIERLKSSLMRGLGWFGGAPRIGGKHV